MKDLTLQWAFQQRSTEKFEATPLVVDGAGYKILELGPNTSAQVMTEPTKIH